uniref:Uncharacterized protein n=1 Tax=Arundo donax TaxID=35708 RepID=A0A0A9U8T2_ARUDO
MAAEAPASLLSR